MVWFYPCIQYSEKGDFKKGHSTKGEHVIHKVDEYEKKHEFFDEDHDDGDYEKDGGFHEEYEHEKVGIVLVFVTK